MLLRKRETTIGPISLVTRNKVCVTNVVVICDVCDPCNATCFTLLTVTRIHNIWKYTKIKNSKDRKGSKDREINLISTKSWKKNKKRVQKKKLIDTQGESNINTPAEELVLSENIASYNPMQNTWNKLEKSSKTGQHKKSMISTFVCFLTATAKV